MKRRGNGEGSIYRRSDGKWCATLAVGYDQNGKRKRRYLYGTDHLIRWPKGTSGNPRGGSRKATIRRTLREATADLLCAELPDAIQEQLASELKGLSPRQAADAIALRLIYWAITSKPDVALAAIQQMRQLELPEREQSEDLQAPELPEDPNRLKEVAEALREAGVIE